MTAVKRSNPQHVAIIMDGNGRWAKERGMPRTFGHRQGAEAVRRAIKAAIELDVRYLTLFGFSTENWQRPESEVSDLMGLLRRFLQSEIAELHRQDIRLRVIGDRSRLPVDIAHQISEAEALTCEGKRLALTVALSYSGRDEILQAVKKLASKVAGGDILPQEISESMIEQSLHTADLPDPDLLIRTSGEQRISNFMLWQLAYSELVFVEKYWPDFDKSDFARACEEFQGRDRRFGATAESG